MKEDKQTNTDKSKDTAGRITNRNLAPQRGKTNLGVLRVVSPQEGVPDVLDVDHLRFGVGEGHG